MIAFGLFLFMRSLIVLAGPGRNDKIAAKSIDFVRVRRDSELQEKKRKLPEKEKIEDAPPPPEIQMPDLDPGKAVIKISAPPIKANLDLGGGPTLTAASDTDVIPLVRVEPMYPRSALDRGIEGYVTVQFTISTTGTVKDPKVIDAQPKAIFNQAAIAAVKKWKYNPRVENGKAVETPGIKVTLEFKINKNE